jgi:hypothetical protein
MHPKHALHKTPNLYGAHMAMEWESETTTQRLYEYITRERRIAHQERGTYNGNKQTHDTCIEVNACFIIT